MEDLDRKTISDRMPRQILSDGVREGTEEKGRETWSFRFRLEHIEAIDIYVIGYIEAILFLGIYIQ